MGSLVSQWRICSLPNHGIKAPWWLHPFDSVDRLGCFAFREDGKFGFDSIFGPFLFRDSKLSPLLFSNKMFLIWSSANELTLRFWLILLPICPEKYPSMNLMVFGLQADNLLMGSRIRPKRSIVTFLCAPLRIDDIKVGPRLSELLHHRPSESQILNLSTTLLVMGRWFSSLVEGAFQIDLHFKSNEKNRAAESLFEVFSHHA